MKSVFKFLFNLIASYGFAVVILFFLLLDTLFGTLAQVQVGLFEAQKKYFESFFLVHHLQLGDGFSIPLPLPGGYLLMILLFTNLTFGGIIRARKDWRRPGILISHLGILFMLLGGAVTYYYSTSGYMRLYEGDQADEFVSYNDWEVLISDVNQDGTGREFAISDEHFKQIGPHGEKDFALPDLPFNLRLSNFYRNCQPIAAPGDQDAVEGFVLAQMPLDKEAEQNVAGVYATVIDKSSGQGLKGLLFGFSQAPWTVNVGGKDYNIELRHTRYKLDPPFTIHLDNFEMNLHPGTGMASNYSSDVTKVEDGSARQIHIKMNEPLRHHGYTFFQSSWGPQGAGPNARLYSVFSVVKNPADQWPKWACYIIAFGLSLHFLQKLLRYLKREQRSRT